MKSISFALLSLFLLSGLGVALVLLIYPAILAFGGWSAKKTDGYGPQDPSLFKVSLITVLHNAEALLPTKLENIRSLLDSGHIHQACLYSDGSSDGSQRLLRKIQDPRIIVRHTPRHLGKSHGLNRMSELATGDLLVYSDVDGLINPGSMAQLVENFEDPLVGGVCGQRSIYKDQGSLDKAQSGYIRFDSLIKHLETRSGSITSNDGKLYAIRKSLFRPIDPYATDDLFSCLSIVSQGYRFVFEPRAKVLIDPPSKDLGHELRRRRRIVARSLHGIFVHRQLFDPKRYGLYALKLGINKVLRRCLPVFFLTILICSALLAWDSALMALFLVLQCLAYLSIVLYPLSKALAANWPTLSQAQRALAVWTYFVLGNLGTLLGLIDFIQGKKFGKWTPVKSND